MSQSRLPAAHWSETRLARLISPMQEFINQSQSSGIILLAATVIALVIANSPLAASHSELLHMPISIAIGPFVLEESLEHWINDGLMALFFFLVGLEIKREMLVGELAEPRAAALPIIAAFGGAVVPALIYLGFNFNSPSTRGWGIPMATDIAFALGCLALLGPKVPFTLKVFLTAVAIVDDLIAVLVIALFYSSQLNMVALGIGGGVLVLLMACNRLGIRTQLVYILLGVVVWLAFLQSGVHATIAGVLVALTIPARSRIDAPTFLSRARELLNHFQANNTSQSRMLTDEVQQSAVLELEEVCEQVQAPLQKMEHSLHSWSGLVIMPVFALANAGVSLSLGTIETSDYSILFGIIIGLVCGKPIGILLSCWLAVRTGLATLPANATWAHMRGVSILAGIGFTMSLFIASLAFTEPHMLAAAKIAILVASLLAGIAGMGLLSRLAPQAQEVDE